jgi:hypothetical protein
MRTFVVFLLLAVAACNTEIQEPELEFDVSGLIKCITEVAPLVPDVIEIINYIKAADWPQVATKAFDAIGKLVPAAKGCIAAFKKELNLGAHLIVDEECTANCKASSPAELTKCLKSCTSFTYDD